jgi:uncharacterized protein YdhG (YjbR/CyaY superfamily)
VAQHPESVDDYISTFPADVQTVLQAVRKTIHAAAPGGERVGQLSDSRVHHRWSPSCYLAGWKKHVSVYPVPELDEKLEPQLAPYLSGKGTAKFPLGRPIPYELIMALVQRLVVQRR